MSLIDSGLKIFAVVCFALLLWVGCASAATLVVSKTSPACTTGNFYYDTIQEAVDMAKDGDNIIVCPGTYVENIEVDKSVSIRSYAGSSNTIIEAKYTPKNIDEAISSKANYSVFNISADYVKIGGFTIKGGCPGIFLNEVSYCEIMNNSLVDIPIYCGGIGVWNSYNNVIINNTIKSCCSAGIILGLSNNNTLTENIISKTSSEGIWMNSSSNNVIRNNLLKLNDNHGVCLYKNCYNNIVEENIILDNGGNGVDLNDGSFNIIRNNTIKSNYMGISLASSNNNMIEENTVSENTEIGINLDKSHDNIIKINDVKLNDRSGIELSHSNNNIIERNKASDNLQGIELRWDSNNNTIKDNVLKSNSINGIYLSSSDKNTMEKNIVLDNFYGIQIDFLSSNNIIKNNVVKSNSEYGILLTTNSNNNYIEGNIASDNDGGIDLSDSYRNIIRNNIIISSDERGINLYSSNFTLIENNNISLNRYQGIYLGTNSIGNLIYHNNIIDNYMFGPFKGYYPQVFEEPFIRPPVDENNWFDYVLLEGNYWSDYKGADDGSGIGKHAIGDDGVGDTKIPHPDFGYDAYPYMNKSGWLTFLLSPEYWAFGTVYQGDIKPQQTFEIQNRGKDDLTILNITSDEDVEITGIELPTTLPAEASKTFTVKIDTKNLEGDILKTLEIVSNDKITPNKMILMYGFVNVYTPGVRVEKTDFESRVIKGQIDLFRISGNNIGVANETNIVVNFTDGDTVLSKEIPELKKNETKTVKFKWDTANASLGIHEIKIEIISGKGELLDSLKVKVSILPASKASTLIVTNLSRLDKWWGENRTAELEGKLIKLSFHPSVNGIIVRVEEDKNCSEAYKLWEYDLSSPEKANKVAKEIKNLIDSKLKIYSNVEYIIIVGDDRIIPYYRIPDNTDKPFGPESWYTEDDYHKLNTDSTVGSALHNNMFLTDNFYAADRPIEWKTAEVNIPELFIPSIPLSRLVETPEEISATIDAFYRNEYIRPDKIFVTAHDFMWDSASYCNSTLEEKTKTRPATIISRNDTEVTPDYFENVKEGLLNASNDVVLIFQHAEHDLFSVPKRREGGRIIYLGITSRDICNSTADLNGSIIYSMSCHAGLNVPPNSAINDFDLVQAFAQKGVVAYTAPTGYGIGSPRTRAAHELLLSYFTRYLCEGIDAGTALTLAKQEYWATNYDFNYFDEQVLETTSLYGLPMVRINIPRSAISYNESEITIKSSVEEQPDTLVIRPTHVLMSTRDGDYYITPGGELLSDPRKPILPKEIRIFHPTPTRILRGAVMTSAKYRIDEPFKPLIEYYQKSDLPIELPTGEMRKWFPARISKINSICYPGRPAESRQYLIIITGQYKGPIGPGAKGIERIYDELSFDLYYASPEDETKPPSIKKVSPPARINRNITITVNASDDESGIRRVLVTYTDINGSWRKWESEDCKHEEGDLWTCNIPAKEEIEFFVQVVDNVGNVAISE